jgi:hypothetical protein
MKPATGGESFWSPPRRTKSFPKKTGRHAGRRVGAPPTISSMFAGLRGNFGL